MDLMSVLIVELLFFFKKKRVRKKVMFLEKKVTISTYEKIGRKDQSANVMVLSNSRENF